MNDDEEDNNNNNKYTLVDICNEEICVFFKGEDLEFICSPEKQM